jgi:hypothetical protein
LILSNGLLGESSNYSRYDDHIVNCFSHWRQQPTTPPAPAPAPALTLPLDPDLTRALDPAFAPALDTTVDFRSAGQSREDENNHMGSPSNERIEW